MKKLWTLLLILFVSLSTSSCINFIESIFIKANGSGTYSFSIDMGELKTLSESMGEELSSEELLSQANLDENTMIPKLEKISGVSNARTEFDEENFTMSIMFDFSNIKALNEGVSTYMADSTKNEVEILEYFEMKNKSITRNNINGIIDAFYEGMSEGEEMDESTLDMMKMMFSDMYFATKLTTEKKMKSYSNEEYKRIDDRTIELKIYPMKNKDSDVSVKVKTK